MSFKSVDCWDAALFSQNATFCLRRRVVFNVLAEFFQNLMLLLFIRSSRKQERHDFMGRDKDTLSNVADVA